MHGFKSFADRCVIEFKPGITGIVGPNGCGKSNINDAIRWVLGEQSAKSLRGSSMADVIFNGSEGRKPQNLAEVTLVFDNSDHYIASDYQEIEITRRLYRDGNEAEYLLNKQHCRLKDIIDLMMDTGLGRDSLSIISQGNISSFADAKPEERRSTFEEAAGVAKYKKRKDESLRKLERTTENLERVQDIVYELERQLGSLRRQKEKAETYISYRQSLKDIEISLIVHEVKKLKDQADDLRQKIQDLSYQQTQIQGNEILVENKSGVARQKMYDLDNEVNQLQDELMKAMTSVQTLEARKAELDAKRQYALNQSDDEMNQRIENLRHVLQETILEYNDRVQRYNQVNAEVRELNERKQALTAELSKINTQIDSTNQSIQVERMAKNQLVDSIENNSGYPSGVRAIVNASASIAGYQGVLGELIEVKDDYDTAIQTALGQASNFIVMKDEQTSRQAINYLKNNKAGRATFLPMTSMKARDVKEDTLTVVSSMDGYLGVAMEFVSYQAKYKEVIASQLGNVLVAKDLKSANQLSHYSYARYKVVTLEGDVVNVGGSMTGGQYRQTQHQSLSSKKKELERVQLRLSNLLSSSSF